MTLGLEKTTSSIGSVRKWTWGFRLLETLRGPTLNSIGTMRYLLANNVLFYVMSELEDDRSDCCHDPGTLAWKYIFSRFNTKAYDWWVVSSGCGSHRIGTELHGAMITLKDSVKLGQLALQGGRFAPNEPSAFADWFFSDAIKCTQQEQCYRLGDNPRYHAGFYYENSNTNEFIASGLNGKSVTWHHNETAGDSRVIPIMALDGTIDRIVDQNCGSNYCTKYRNQNSLLFDVTTPNEEDEEYFGALGSIGIPDAGILKFKDCEVT